MIFKNVLKTLTRKILNKKNYIYNDEKYNILILLKFVVRDKWM